MFKMQSEILTKDGKSTTNWRQLIMFTNDDESKFELREYYGQRKITYAKEVLRLKFDSYGVAIMNFINLKQSRIIDGYNVIESLCEKSPFMPFIKFKPPAYTFKMQADMVDSLACMKDPVAIPVTQDGQRVYIRFGHEALSSIVAQDYKGDEVPLNEVIAKRVLTKVKIGQFENGIIETYIEHESVTVMDILSLNGEEVKLNFKKRVALAKSIFGTKSFNYPTVVDPRIGKEKLSARHYIVKENNGDGFGGLVVPNFYSVSVVVMSIKEGLRKEVNVHFTTDDGYQEIGTFITTAPIEISSIIQIAFHNTENGLPVSFWLSPIRGKNTAPCSEAPIEQMDNLKAHWYGL